MRIIFICICMSLYCAHIHVILSTNYILFSSLPPFAGPLWIAWCVYIHICMYTHVHIIYLSIYKYKIFIWEKTWLNTYCVYILNSLFPFTSWRAPRQVHVLYTVLPAMCVCVRAHASTVLFWIYRSIIMDHRSIWYQVLWWF